MYTFTVNFKIWELLIMLNYIMLNHILIVFAHVYNKDNNF